MRKLTFYIGAIFYCGYIEAQQQDTIAIETVSVYSTGIVMNRNESGRNILVIPGSEIRRSNASSLDELLRYLPGIEAQSRGAFGIQSDLSMRGGSFADVLVIIDGIRLNDPLTGHFNSYIPVSISEIDHIEILFGPASGIYGADAVGGVINIITKSFTASNDKPEKQLEGKLLTGEYGLVSLQAGGSYRNNNSGIEGGISWNRSDGNPLPSGERGWFDIRTASLSYEKNISVDTRISVRTALDWRQYNAQYFYTGSPADSSHERVNQWWNQLRLQHKTGRHEENIDLGYKQNHDDYVFNAESPANIHRTDQLQLRLQETYSITKDFQIQCGLQSGYMHITSTDRGNHADGNTGIYLLGVLKAIPSLVISGGIRTEYNPAFKFEQLPQASIAWTRDKFLLRASIGRSIRAADFTERYVSTFLPVVSAFRNVGNPNLKAERAWNEEIGSDIQLFKNNTISLTAFYRSANNLIDYVLTNESAISNNQNLVAGADYLYATNISSLQTKGVEMFYTSYMPVSSSVQGKLRLGYTIQKSDNSEHIVSKYISNQARQLFTGDASIQAGRLQLQLNGLWKLRESDFSQSLNIDQKSEYTVWNVSISVDILKNKLALMIQANNIFNEYYSDILGAAMPGRWLMAGIRWKLSE